MAVLLTTTALYAQAPFDTLKRLRPEYSTPMSREQAAALLNRVAWEHRADGLTLLGKTQGNNCPLPVTGQLISCDFVVYSTTLQGYDVLIGWDTAGTPSWQGPEDLTSAINSGARSIVFPVNPSLPSEPPVPPPTLPPTQPPVVVPGPIVGLQEQILAELRQHETAEAIERAKAEAFRVEVKTVWESIGKPALTFTGKYILPAVLAWFGGKAIAN